MVRQTRTYVTILFTFDYFTQFINEVTHLETKNALSNLAQLFVIEQTVENAHLLTSLAVISSEQIRKLKIAFESTLEVVYKDCLTLVDDLVVDLRQ